MTTFAATLAAALDGGDVGCVQLRLKDVDDDTIRLADDMLRLGRDAAFAAEAAWMMEVLS